MAVTGSVVQKIAKLRLSPFSGEHHGTRWKSKVSFMSPSIYLRRKLVEMFNAYGSSDDAVKQESDEWQDFRPNK
jgi:hypothetical protein